MSSNRAFLFILSIFLFLPNAVFTHPASDIVNATAAQPGKLNWLQLAQKTICRLTQSETVQLGACLAGGTLATAGYFAMSGQSPQLLKKYTYPAQKNNQAQETPQDKHKVVAEALTSETLSHTASRQSQHVTLDNTQQELGSNGAPAAPASPQLDETQVLTLLSEEGQARSQLVEKSNAELKAAVTQAAMPIMLHKLTTEALGSAQEMIQNEHDARNSLLNEFQVATSAAEVSASTPASVASDHEPQFLAEQAKEKGPSCEASDAASKPTDEHVELKATTLVEKEKSADSSYDDQDVFSTIYKAFNTSFAKGAVGLSLLQGPARMFKRWFYPTYSGQPFPSSNSHLPIGLASATSAPPASVPVAAQSAAAVCGLSDSAVKVRAVYTDAQRPAGLASKTAEVSSPAMPYGSADSTALPTSEPSQGMVSKVVALFRSAPASKAPPSVEVLEQPMALTLSGEKSAKAALSDPVVQVDYDYVMLLGSQAPENLPMSATVVQRLTQLGNVEWQKHLASHPAALRGGSLEEDRSTFMKGLFQLAQTKTGAARLQKSAANSALPAPEGVASLPAPATAAAGTSWLTKALAMIGLNAAVGSLNRLGQPVLVDGLGECAANVTATAADVAKGAAYGAAEAMAGPSARTWYLPAPSADAAQDAAYGVAEAVEQAAQIACETVADYVDPAAAAYVAAATATATTAGFVGWKWWQARKQRAADVPASASPQLKVKKQAQLVDADIQARAADVPAPASPQLKVKKQAQLVDADIQARAATEAAQANSNPASISKQLADLAKQVNGHNPDLPKIQQEMGKIKSRLGTFVPGNITKDEQAWNNINSRLGQLRAAPRRRLPDANSADSSQGRSHPTSSATYQCMPDSVELQKKQVQAKKVLVDAVNKLVQQRLKSPGHAASLQAAVLEQVEQGRNLTSAEIVQNVFDQVGNKFDSQQRYAIKASLEMAVYQYRLASQRQTEAQRPPTLRTASATCSPAPRTGTATLARRLKARAVADREEMCAAQGRLIPKPRPTLPEDVERMPGEAGAQQSSTLRTASATCSPAPRTGTAMVARRLKARAVANREAMCEAQGRLIPEPPPTLHLEELEAEEQQERENLVQHEELVERYAASKLVEQQVQAATRLGTQAEQRQALLKILDKYHGSYYKDIVYTTAEPWAQKIVGELDLQQPIFWYADHHLQSLEQAVIKNIISNSINWALQQDSSTAKINEILSTHTRLITNFTEAYALLHILHTHEEISNRHYRVELQATENPLTQTRDLVRNLVHTLLIHEIFEEYIEHKQETTFEQVEAALRRENSALDQALMTLTSLANSSCSTVPDQNLQQVCHKARVKLLLLKNDEQCHSIVNGALAQCCRHIDQPSDDSRFDGYTDPLTLQNIQEDTDKYHELLKNPMHIQTLLQNKYPNKPVDQYKYNQYFCNSIIRALQQHNTPPPAAAAAA